MSLHGPKITWTTEKRTNTAESALSKINSKTIKRATTIAKDNDNRQIQTQENKLEIPSKTVQLCNSRKIFQDYSILLKQVFHLRINSQKLLRDIIATDFFSLFCV